MTDKIDISPEAVEKHKKRICSLSEGPQVGSLNYDTFALLDALAAQLDRAEAEKIAIAQRFDEYHPDPALMARIILNSIDNECRADDAEAKVKALVEALRVAVKGDEELTVTERPDDNTQRYFHRLGRADAINAALARVTIALEAFEGDRDE